MTFNDWWDTLTPKEQNVIGRNNAKFVWAQACESCAQLAEGWQYLPENNFTKEQVVENMCNTFAYYMRARGQA